MNRRSNKILNKLILGEKENIATLANTFHVQERTVRAEIKELNQDLQEYHLPKISINTEGDIWIEGVRNIDFTKFEEFILHYNYYTYYLSKNERETILAMILLNAKSYTTLEKLSEKVGVSKNTLLRDFNELKNWFIERDMKLVSQVGKGYFVAGSEMTIRDRILKLLELNGDETLYKSGCNLSVFWNLMLQEVDHLQAFDKVRDYLTMEEELQQAFLTDFSFLEASIELLISINRIAIGKKLPEYYLKQWLHLQKSSKYDFSKDIFEKLTAQYNLEINEVAVLHYTECLRGKSYLKNNSNHLDMFDIRILIGEIIYRISNSFEIDFYLDFSLYDLLIDHMRSAVHRLQSGEVLNNPLKDELEKAYPDIFRIVEEHIQPLEDYIGKKFSKDEMSFMVLYFASVIEKDKAENQKLKIIPVALVCGTGRGTAQLMLARLKTLDSILDIVEITAAHNIREIEDSGAKMIITTVPLPETRIPYIKVKSPMLLDEDIKNISILAMEVRNQIRHQEESKTNKTKKITPTENGGEFCSLLAAEKIELEYEADNWEDAVREAGYLLYKNGDVEKQYIEAMVNNIKENGPYIVIYPGIAIPHSDTEKGVIREAASIVRLKNPIDFNSGLNDPVHYVIGLSILSAQSINRAIYDMTMIFGDERKRKRLDEIQDHVRMLELLQDLERQI